MGVPKKKGMGWPAGLEPASIAGIGQLDVFGSVLAPIIHLHGWGLKREEKRALRERLTWGYSHLIAPLSS